MESAQYLIVIPFPEFFDGINGNIIKHLEKVNIGHGNTASVLLLRDKDIKEIKNHLVNFTRVEPVLQLELVSGNTGHIFLPHKETLKICVKYGGNLPDPLEALFFVRTKKRILNIPIWNWVIRISIEKNSAL